MNQTDSDHALAMLLAQEYDDYDYYSRYDAQDEEEYDKKRKRKEPKKDIKPKPEKNLDGMNTGKFTDEEIAKFKEGLQLYGRDWTQVSDDSSGYSAYWNKRL
jgi:hypothetical protein